MMFSPMRILEIVVFLDQLAAGLIVPLLPIHVRGLGCSFLWVGIMGALYSGLQFLSGPAISSLSDLKGRTSVLMLTLTLSGLAYASLGTTSSIVLLLVLRSVLGITKHTQRVIKALAPEFINEEYQLTEVYGRFSTLKQVGMCVGPIIAGYIREMYPHSGFTIIASTVGIIFAVNAGLVQKLPQVDEEKKDQEKDKTAVVPKLLNAVTTNFNESLNQVHEIDWSVYGELFLLRFLISLSLGIYVNSYVLYLMTKFNSTPITIGYIIAFFSAIGSFATYFNKYNEIKFYLFCILTTCLLESATTSSVLVYVVLLIPLAVSAGIVRVTILEVILSKTDNNERDLVLGVDNNVRAVSSIVAPLLVGMIGEFIGVSYVGYASVILAGLGTYKSYVLRNENVENVEEKEE